MRERLRLLAPCEVPTLGPGKTARFQGVWRTQPTKKSPLFDGKPGTHSVKYDSTPGGGQERAIETNS